MPVLGLFLTGDDKQVMPGVSWPELRGHDAERGEPGACPGDG